MIDILRYLLYTISGIGGISCFIFYRKLPPVFLRLGFYLLFAMLSQVLAFTIARHFGSNIEYYNMVLLVNYLVTYAVFRKMSDDEQYKKRILIAFATGGVFILYFIIQSFNISFANRALTIFNITATVFALLYFYHILQVADEQPATKKGRFWIATGFLVHHLASFSYWLLYEYRSYAGNGNLIASITIYLGILLYSILLYAIYVQLKFGKYDRA